MSTQAKFAGRALRVAAVSGIVFGTLAPATAFATGYPDEGGTSTPNDPGSQVEAANASKSSTLPFTGSDATGIALIGVGAVAAGAVFVRQSRRRAVSV